MNVVQSASCEVTSYFKKNYKKFMVWLACFQELLELLEDLENWCGLETPILQNTVMLL